MAETRYTHGHHESVLRSHRTRTAANSAGYLLGQLRPGLSVLDVGSGPGTITVDLARRVAPGRVTAVENTLEALDLTRAEVVRTRTESVDLAVADVQRLDFDDDSFDVVHAHQVLQHVGDSVQALREMARVCRAGGIVAARDADYQSFTWFPLVEALDEWLRLYRRIATHNGGEPDAGRRLLHWAHRAGLADVTATASIWCYATPAERQGWGGMWADRVLDSDFAQQAVEFGGATRQQLQRISDSWLAWADAPDGWLIVPHGEIIVRV